MGYEQIIRIIKQKRAREKQVLERKNDIASCEKCNGAGWLWAHELDPIPDWIEYPWGDNQKYDCDGEVCKKYDKYR